LFQSNKDEEFFWQPNKSEKPKNAHSDMFSIHESQFDLDIHDGEVHNQNKNLNRTTSLLNITDETKKYETEEIQVIKLEPCIDAKFYSLNQDDEHLLNETIWKSLYEYYTQCIFEAKTNKKTSKIHHEENKQILLIKLDSLFTIHFSQCFSPSEIENSRNLFELLSSPSTPHTKKITYEDIKNIPSLYNPT
jgi:flagellin-specific chaperone FliS